MVLLLHSIFVLLSIRFDGFLKGAVMELGAKEVPRGIRVLALQHNGVSSNLQHLCTKADLSLHAWIPNIKSQKQEGPQSLLSSRHK